MNTVAGATTTPTRTPTPAPVGPTRTPGPAGGTASELAQQAEALGVGIEIVEVGDAWSLYRLPYDEKLVGNPETGVADDIQGLYKTIFYFPKCFQRNLAIFIQPLLFNGLCSVDFSIQLASIEQWH